MQDMDASRGTDFIPRAFPALHSLALIRMQLGGGLIFNLLAAQPSPSLTSLHLACCSLDSAAVQHAAVALARLPGLQALHLEGADLPVHTALAARMTGLTCLHLRTDKKEAVLDEQQAAVVVQNRSLRSLSLVNTRLSEQVLHPDLVQRMLTSCTGVTQLTLSSQCLDDQGLGVLLTHGTSITDLTLGDTYLTTSKADWACSWRNLSIYGVLWEYAYLPLKSVQQLKVTSASLGQLELPSDTVHPAQLPNILHKATRNLASCPAWVRSPPSELALVAAASTLNSAERVQLLQALAPVAGGHVSKLKLCCKMQLGQDEAEALAGSIADSLIPLHLDWATVHDSFWKPLAQRFPNLQELCLDSGLKADVISVATYLAMFSAGASQQLRARIECFNAEDALYLYECVDEWGLENIDLDVAAAPPFSDGFI
jgi:hypothetical protein